MQLKNISLICKALITVICSTIQIQACESTSKFSLHSDLYGNFVTIWIEDENEISVIKSSTKAPDEDWLPAITLSNPDENSVNPVLETTENGDIVAVWLALNQETQKNVLVAATLPYKGNWSTPTIISDPAELIINNTHRIKASAGDITVVWNSVVIEKDKAINVLRTSTAKFGKNWSDPRTLSVN